MNDEYEEEDEEEGAQVAQGTRKRVRCHYNRNTNRNTNTNKQGGKPEPVKFEKLCDIVRGLSINRPREMQQFQQADSVARDHSFLLSELQRHCEEDRDTELAACVALFAGEREPSSNLDITLAALMCVGEMAASEKAAAPVKGNSFMGADNLSAARLVATNDILYTARMQHGANLHNNPALGSIDYRFSDETIKGLQQLKDGLMTCMKSVCLADAAKVDKWQFPEGLTRSNPAYTFFYTLAQIACPIMAPDLSPYTSYEALQDFTLDVLMRMPTSAECMSLTSFGTFGDSRDQAVSCFLFGLVWFVLFALLSDRQ